LHLKYKKKSTSKQTNKTHILLSLHFIFSPSTSQHAKIARLQANNNGLCISTKLKSLPSIRLLAFISSRSIWTEPFRTETFPFCSIFVAKNSTQFHTIDPDLLAVCAVVANFSRRRSVGFVFF
jgi:hypothetical protein